MKLRVVKGVDRASSKGRPLSSDPTNDLARQRMCRIWYRLQYSPRTLYVVAAYNLEGKMRLAFALNTYSWLFCCFSNVIPIVYGDAQRRVPVLSNDRHAQIEMVLMMTQRPAVVVVTARWWRARPRAVAVGCARSPRTVYVASISVPELKPALSLAKNSSEIIRSRWIRPNRTFIMLSTL